MGGTPPQNRGGPEKIVKGFSRGVFFYFPQSRGKIWVLFCIFSFKIRWRKLFLGKPWEKTRFFPLKFVEKIDFFCFHEVRRRPWRFRPIATLGALKKRSFLAFFGVFLGMGGVPPPFWPKIAQKTSFFQKERAFLTRNPPPFWGVLGGILCVFRVKMTPPGGGTPPLRGGYPPQKGGSGGAFFQK